jgi:ubiquinone/menaquinone biosynthesis C-methylase UbiE
MLEKVNATAAGCDIQLQIAQIEKMPFKSNSYDTASAYAVLHHLHDLQPAFKELYRVLKPGGVFYSDTDPNYYFWEAVSALPDAGPYDEIVTREIYAVKHKDDELEDQFNIPKEVLNTAEVLKHVHGGFKEEELKEMLYAVGFSSVEIRYEWFMGEARIIHSEFTNNAVNILRNHLRDMLPLSRNLFKYVSIYATK